MPLDSVGYSKKSFFFFHKFEERLASSRKIEMNLQIPAKQCYPLSSLDVPSTQELDDRFDLGLVNFNPMMTMKPLILPEVT